MCSDQTRRVAVACAYAYVYAYARSRNAREPVLLSELLFTAATMSFRKASILNCPVACFKRDGHAASLL